MTPVPSTRWSRRSFLWAIVSIPASYALAACSRLIGAPQAPEPTRVRDSVPTKAAPIPPDPTHTRVAPTQAERALAPTPACGDDDDVTPPQAAGPFFTPDSPERASLLEAGLSGTRLVLSGTVLTTGCRPVANALLDFWHCDANGNYDNVGYTFRGHQFTDADGRYQLETIVPGLYPGRTRHIHLHVQAADQPVLTTQLYFPGEPDNARDSIYNPALEMELQDTEDGKLGSFNFVLGAA